MKPKVTILLFQAVTVGMTLLLISQLYQGNDFYHAPFTLKQLASL